MAGNINVYNTQTNTYDLHNAGLERDAIAFSYWNETINFSRFNTLLSMLSRRNTIGSKKFEFPIGDIPATMGQLAADVTMPAAGSTVSIPVVAGTIDYLQEGDMLRIVDGSNEAIVRLVGTASGTPPTYSNAVVVYNSAAAGTIYAAATSVVDTLLDAAPYDGEAPQSIDMLPSKLYNVMQRTRMAYGKGQWARAGIFVHDNSITKLGREVMRIFSIRESLALFFNPEPVEADSNDIGIAAGLVYFFNPRRIAGNPGPAVNVVRPATVSLDFDFFSSLLAEFTKGGEVKWFVASPTVIQKVLGIFKQVTAITKTEYGVFSEDNMWKVGGSFLTVEFSTRRLVLIPDETLRGRQLFVDDGTNTYNGTEWGMIIDPAHVRKVFLDVPGKGVQIPHIEAIDKVRNSSIDEYEITSTWSTIVEDPETCGIIANI